LKNTKRFKHWIVILLFCAVALPALNDTMYYTPDSSNYLGWAQSLASFEGFKLTYGPETSRYVINAPFYSVLLAPVAFIFPLNPVAAKALTLAFGGLLLWLFHRYVSARTGHLAAFLGLIVLASNAQTLLYATQVLSDIPFAALLLLIFLLVDRLTLAESKSQWTLTWLVLSLCAAVLLREIGTSLLLAVVFFFAMRKEFARAGLLLLIPVLVLLLWYVRNELMVGNVELPELRNSKLFLSHVLTENGAGLLQEFRARLASNFSAYSQSLAGILFQSGTSGWMLDVVDYRDQALTFLTDSSSGLLLITGLLTIVIAGFGIYRLWRSVNNGRLAVYFLLFYSAIVLLYPIIDSRFMFPILLFLVLSFTLCVANILEWLGRQAVSLQKPYAVVLVLAVIILLVPNFIWERNFFSTALAYKHSPEDLFASTQDVDRYPTEYTKWIRRACEWINAHGGENGTTITRYQQAGLWLAPHRLISFGPLVAPGIFDEVARYYNAQFVIAFAEKGRLGDFAFQMAASTRFGFVSAFRTGDLEVFRLHPLSSAEQSSSPVPPDSSSSDRSRFLGACSKLQGGDYAAARGEFEQLKRSPGFAAPATFYTGLAAEFAGDLTSAKKEFLQLGTYPQAGPYLTQTRVHQDILAFLDSARTAPHDRAWYYHSVSVSYWMMGFHRQAEEAIAQCITADPSYFLGPMFAVLYLLQKPDIAAARLYAQHAEKLRPGDTLVTTLKELITLTDSATQTISGKRGSDLHTQLGRKYQSLGLNDFAADQFATAVGLDSSNTEALITVADIHILRNRFSPASLALKQALRNDPSDKTIQEKLDRLRDRVE
jgi:tetratricopeptide (TPR) repeat protein